MFRILAVAAVACVQFVSIAISAESNRARIFDKEITPLLSEMSKHPSPATFDALRQAIEAFNTIVPAASSKKPVESLDPLWLQTQLREKGIKKAAISLCGAELLACDKATEYLQMLTAQCSDVFLGVIDVNKYPGTPRNLYDTTDPRLILLMQTPELKALVPVTLNATTNADTVAVALCPEESKAFGPALRALNRPIGFN